MKRFEKISKPLTWLMALLLTALMAGCGGGSSSDASSVAVTLPTVSSTVPADAATGIARNASIVATFNIAMDPATITNATFTLTQGSTVVPSVVTYFGTTATLSPAVTLAASTTYTATITTGAMDLAGNALAANKTWSFDTAADAPIVSTTVPANLATGVATNAKISATFSKAMDPLTISNTTFTLTPPGSAVPATVTYAGTTAILNPGTLANSTVYTATITTGVKDAAGNAMVSNKTWSFTTGTTADTAPPTVSATTPLNTATGVALNANVTATFSEAMDPSTITSTSFTLMQGATPVSGVVSNVGTTATFNPAANLTANTLYTATVTTGVKDLAGNAMLANNVWTFTTGSTVAAGPKPVVLGTAANYAVLAKTAVSTVPSSAVTGNVGVSPAAATYLTGWSQTDVGVPVTHSTSAQVVAPFQLHAADYTGGTTSADLTTAVLNMEAAYTDAAGRTATSAATTNVGAGTLTSLTLTPGVYEWGSNVTIPTDLTLNGTATDVWIFNVSGTLDMAAAKRVLLSGGASAKNIFWRVAGAVTIGTTAHFEGVILGQTSITFRNLSSINGRLLAQTAVVLDATTVTQPLP